MAKNTIKIKIILLKLKTHDSSVTDKKIKLSIQLLSITVRQRSKFN
jgi:hypothetical protein